MKFEEWFARHSFEHDKKEGEYVFDNINSFDELNDKEKLVYLEEARLYIPRDMNGEDGSIGWPTDILEKMKMPGKRIKIYDPKIGMKVRWEGCNGFRSNPNKNKLIIGKEYEIAAYQVYDYYTNIYLRGYQELGGFNHCSFSVEVSNDA